MVKQFWTGLAAACLMVALGASAFGAQTRTTVASNDSLGSQFPGTVGWSGGFESEDGDNIVGEAGHTIRVMSTSYMNTLTLNAGGACGLNMSAGNALTISSFGGLGSTLELMGSGTIYFDGSYTVGNMIEVTDGALGLTLTVRNNSDITIGDLAITNGASLVLTSHSDGGKFTLKKRNSEVGNGQLKVVLDDYDLTLENGGSGVTIDIDQISIANQKSLTLSGQGAFGFSNSVAFTDAGLNIDVSAGPLTLLLSNNDIAIDNITGAGTLEIRVDGGNSTLTINELANASTVVNINAAAGNLDITVANGAEFRVNSLTSGTGRIITLKGAGSILFDGSVSVPSTGVVNAEGNATGFNIYVQDDKVLKLNKIDVGANETFSGGYRPGYTGAVSVGGVDNGITLDAAGTINLNTLRVPASSTLGIPANGTLNVEKLILSNHGTLNLARNLSVTDFVAEGTATLTGTSYTLTVTNSASFGQKPGFPSEVAFQTPFICSGDTGVSMNEGNVTWSVSQSTAFGNDTSDSFTMEIDGDNREFIVIDGSRNLSVACPFNVGESGTTGKEFTLNLSGIGGTEPKLTLASDFRLASGGFYLPANSGLVVGGNAHFDTNGGDMVMHLSSELDCRGDVAFTLDTGDVLIDVDGSSPPKFGDSVTEDRLVLAATGAYDFEFVDGNATLTGGLGVTGTGSVTLKTVDDWSVGGDMTVSGALKYNTSLASQVGSILEIKGQSTVRDGGSITILGDDIVKFVLGSNPTMPDDDGDGEGDPDGTTYIIAPGASGHFEGINITPIPPTISIANIGSAASTILRVSVADTIGNSGQSGLYDLYYSGTKGDTSDLGFIVGDVPAWGTTAEIEWDVSEVAAGSYYLYGYLLEGTLEATVWSSGTATVSTHAPALVFPIPDSATTMDDLSGNPPEGTKGALGSSAFVVPLNLQDPDEGTLSLALYYSTTYGSKSGNLIASLSNLSKGEQGYTWDSSGLSEGDYYLYGVLADATGGSDTTMATYAVRVGAGGGSGDDDDDDDDDDDGGSGGTTADDPKLGKYGCDIRTKSDKTSYNLGDRMEVRISFTQRDLNSDVYIALADPFGGIHCMDAGGGLGPAGAIYPLVSNWSSVPITSLPVLSVALAPGVPSGKYKWWFVFVDAGKDVGNTDNWLAYQTWALTIK